MTTKEEKVKLADGAKEIQKAQKEADAKKIVPVQIDNVTRDIRDILKDRVTPLDGNIGVKLSPDTTLGECLRIMDWATSMNEHVGFIIGDIICFGQSKWGEKYAQAVEQTGRAYQTLAEYAMTARRIPANKRVSVLTYTHHRTALRIGDDSKIEKLLHDVGEQANKGKRPTTREFIEKVVKLTPRKVVKKAKKPTAGRGRKPQKKVVLPPPYKPTEAEEEKLEEGYVALEEAGKLVPKLLPLIGRLGNKEKNRWLKLSQPFVVFYNTLEKITGYED